MSRRALLVGTGAYSDDQDAVYTRLFSPESDLEIMERTLKLPHVGFLVDPPLLNPTLRQAGLAVSQFMSNCQGDDLFLYLTGHGDVCNNEYYYVLADTESSHLDATALTGGVLPRIIDRCPARSITMIVDTCRAGQLAGLRRQHGNAKGPLPSGMESLSGEGVNILCAAPSTGVAFERRDPDPDHVVSYSLYTSAICIGLRDGRPVAGGRDPIIRPSALANFAKSLISEYCKFFAEERVSLPEYFVLGPAQEGAALASAQSMADDSVDERVPVTYFDRLHHIHGWAIPGKHAQASDFTQTIDWGYDGNYERVSEKKIEKLNLSTYVEEKQVKVSPSITPRSEQAEAHARLQELIRAGLGSPAQVDRAHMPRLFVHEFKENVQRILGLEPAEAARRIEEALARGVLRQEGPRYIIRIHL